MPTLVTLFPAVDGDTSPSAAGGRPTWQKVVGFWTGLVSMFFLALAASLALWAVVPALMPQWESSVVASGSMAPRIKTGDVVVWNTDVPDNVGDGSVIVFLDNKNQSFIHRVVGRTPEGDLITKGDANPMRDTDPVVRARQIGYGQVLVPIIGTPGVWAGQHQWLLLVGLAVAIVSGVRASRRVSDPAFDSWRRNDELILSGSGLAEPVRLSTSRHTRDPDDDLPALLPASVRAILISTDTRDER